MTVTSHAESGFDRRREPRTPLHLNVILLQDGERPRGCRVLNVSQSGMFLEWSDAHATEETAAEHFTRGDTIKILFSFRTPSGRKHLELPSRVMRTEGKGIGVAFDEPQPVINELVDTYEEQRKNKKGAHNVEMPKEAHESSLAESTSYDDKNTTDVPLTNHIASTDPTEDFTSKLNEELLEAIDELSASTALPDIDGPVPPTHITFDDSDEQREGGVTEERFTELLSTVHVEHRAMERSVSKVAWMTGVLAAALITTNVYYFYDIQQQISHLRATLAQTAENLASRIKPPVSIDALEDSVNKISDRVVALDASVAGIHEQLSAWTPPKPSVPEETAPAPMVSALTPAEIVETLGLPPKDEAEKEAIDTSVSPPPDTSEHPDRAAPRVAESQQKNIEETKTTQPSVSPPKETESQPASKSTQGVWVINLLTLRRQKAAEHFVEKAVRLGIPVTMEKSEGKNGPLWRLRVNGLESASAAKDYAREITPKLGLESTWISKRKLVE